MKSSFLRRALAGVFAVFIATGLVGRVADAADIGEQTRKLQEFTRAFNEMALRVGTSPAIELARWTGPIYLAIADTPGIERVAGDVESLVQRLATVARVSVERVAVNDPRRNFYVRASTRESNGSHPCLSNIDWDEAGRIMAVEVKLNLSNFSRLTRCANHEVVHGFGLRAHPDGAYSILSYRFAHVAQPTETDEMVLATLYDGRLPATGSMTDTARIACGIIAERLRIAPDAAAPFCARHTAPPRRGLFAAAGERSDARETIGQ